MIIAPNGDVTLVKNAPVDPTLKNFLLFPSEQAQAQYMQTLYYAKYTECVYTNKANDGTPMNEIRVQGSADHMIANGVNLIMYKNNNFTTTPRWYYGYITDIRQENQEVTSIQFEPAWIMTFIYDVKFGEALIERMHVKKSEDVAGAFLIDEGIDGGPIITNEAFGFFDRKGKEQCMMPHIVIRCDLSTPDNLNIYGEDGITVKNVLTGAVPTFSGGHMIGGLFQGCSYISSGPIFYKDQTGFFQPAIQTMERLNRFCTQLVKDGQIEKIQDMFICPEMIVQALSMHILTDEDIGNPSSIEIIGTASPGTNCANYERQEQIPTDVAITKSDMNPDAIDGYEPRNKKLLNSQYNYLLVSDGSNTKEMAFEYFNRGTEKFREPIFQYYGGCDETGAKVGIFPVNYKVKSKKLYVSTDEGMTITNFPSCSYVYNPAINNWMKYQYSNTGQHFSSINNNLRGAVTGLASATANAALSFSSLSDDAMKTIPKVGKNATKSEWGKGVATGVGAMNDPSVGFGIAGAMLDIAHMNYGMQEKGADMIRHPAICSGQANSSLRGMLMGLWYYVKTAVLPERQKRMPIPIDFELSHMSITQDYAERLDKFFDRYGYKVEKVMKISDAFSTRSNFNYVKTVDAIIKEYSGPRIVYDMLTAMLNNGVTIWHDPSGWMDYAKANN